MEWFGMDGRLKLVPFHHCYGQGHLPPSKAAPGPVQPGFWHFQRWGSHSSSVPGPHNLHWVKSLSLWQHLWVKNLALKRGEGARHMRGGSVGQCWDLPRCWGQIWTIWRSNQPWPMLQVCRLHPHLSPVWVEELSHACRKMCRSWHCLPLYWATSRTESVMDSPLLGQFYTSISHPLTFLFKAQTLQQICPEVQQSLWGNSPELRGKA